MPRLGSTLAALLAATLTGAVLTAAPAHASPLAIDGPSDSESAATPRATAPVPAPAPGHQLMFDTCDTPSISQIRTWQHYSPFKAIAAYIPARSDFDMWYCRDHASRSNLTAAWVDQVLAGGWNIMATQVGLQAPCSKFSKRMSSDASTARAQGVAAASDAAARVRALRIPATSPIVADIEAYPRGGSCTTAVQSYVAGWATRLHQLGLRSAVYGSKASTITDMVHSPTTRPDVIWVANYNGEANTSFDTSLMPAGMWAGLRASQFTGGTTRTYGGVTLNIDHDAVQVSVWDRTGPRLAAKQPPRATKAKRVRIGWRAVDPSGVRSYQVRFRHNGGHWRSSKKLRHTKRTNQVFSFDPGDRWCVQSRATDRVGNTSPWSPARCTSRFRDDRSLKAGKGWKRVHGSYLGTGTRTVRRGAVLRGKRVSGRYVGVILHGRGTVAVLIGGHVVGTVRGDGVRWIALPSARSGRIALRTVTRGKVVVDGYVVTS